MQVQVHVRGGSGEEGDTGLHTQLINTVALTTHTSRSWGVGGGEMWGGMSGGVGGGMSGGGVGGGRVNGGVRRMEVGGCPVTNQALSSGSGSIKHWCGV